MNSWNNSTQCKHKLNTIIALFTCTIQLTSIAWTWNKIDLNRVQTHTLSLLLKEQVVLSVSLDQYTTSLSGSTSLQATQSSWVILSFYELSQNLLSYFQLCLQFISAVFKYKKESMFQIHANRIETYDSANWLIN